MKKRPVTKAHDERKPKQPYKRKKIRLSDLRKMTDDEPLTYLHD